MSYWPQHRLHALKLNVSFTMGKPQNYEVERAFKLIERAHPPDIMMAWLYMMMLMTGCRCFE